MARWYIILPGTRIVVSENGTRRDETLRDQLNFQEPAHLDDETATFQQGSRTIEVARRAVVMSDYDGQQGTNTWGI